MESVLIGQLEQRTSEGLRKYVLIIPKEHHHAEAIMIHCQAAMLSEKKTAKEHPDNDIKRRDQIRAALISWKRLQASGLPYTGIVDEDRVAFLDGTIEPISASDLEQQWFTDLEAAMPKSTGQTYLQYLGYLAVRSTEDNTVALLRAVNRWLRKLVIDETTLPSDLQSGSAINEKVLKVILCLHHLHCLLLDFPEIVLRLKFNNNVTDGIASPELPPVEKAEISQPIQTAFKEIIEQLLTMVLSNRRWHMFVSGIENFIVRIPNYDKGEELMLEIARRTLLITEVKKYLRREHDRGFSRSLFDRIEHPGNIEKYLAFDEKNVDIIVIPYLAYYPRICYDHSIQHINQSDHMLDSFLPLARYEPSLIYTAAFEPELARFNEIQKRKDEWCLNYISQTNEKNWKRYYKTRQNYFCFLLEYHTPNLTKRVVLSPLKDSPQVHDGSFGSDIRIEVFLNDLENADSNLIQLVRINKSYSEATPMELPRELLLTWSEDFSAAYIKDLLINEKDSLNSLLGLINYSGRYLETFMEIITEESAVNKHSNHQIIHSGCAWALLILIRKYMPNAFVDCLFFKKKFGKFFRVMTLTINSLMSYGVMKVYIDAFKSQFNETLVSEKDQSAWTTSVAKLEKELEARYDAEWLFNDFFDAEDEEKYCKDGKKKELFENSVKKFYFVLILVFIQKLSYLFVKKSMHPIANRTIYRMKELIHQFSVLRRNFYYEEFQKIVRNVLFGEWADGMTVKAKLPPKFITLTSLFIKTWPELHAQELIGKTILGQYNVASMKVIKSFPSSATSSVQLVNVPNYVSPAVAKRYLGKDRYFHVSEVLELLMRIQSHPHILRLYGYLIEDDDYVGILMEHCNGGTLLRVIDQGADYSDDDIFSWAAQVTSGLLFLHHNEIVHGKLSPAKMFLNLSKKNIKIGGFGIKGSERPPGITDSKLSDIFSLGKSFEYMVEKRPTQNSAVPDLTDFTNLYKSMTTENDNETPKLAEILQKLKRTLKNKGI